MTPTKEEVAGWLREAGKKEEVRQLRSGASIHEARAEGETWYLRAAQVEAMGWLRRPNHTLRRTGGWVGGISLSSGRIRKRHI